MTKYIKNLEDKVSSILRESLVDDAAELVGIDRNDAEERIKGLSFANYLELGNAVDIDDEETAREILSTVAPIKEEALNEIFGLGNKEEKMAKYVAELMRNEGRHIAMIDIKYVSKGKGDKILSLLKSYLNNNPDGEYAPEVSWVVKEYEEDTEKMRDTEIKAFGAPLGETDNPYQTVTPPSQQMPSSTMSNTNQRMTAGRKDINNLSVGDNIEVIDMDDEPQAVKVKNPRSPGDTLVVQNKKGEEFIVKKQAVTGTPKMESIGNKNLQVGQDNDGKWYVFRLPSKLKMSKGFDTEDEALKKKRGIELNENQKLTEDIWDVIRDLTSKASKELFDYDYAFDTKGGWKMLTRFDGMRYRDPTRIVFNNNTAKESLQDYKKKKFNFRSEESKNKWLPIWKRLATTSPTEAIDMFWDWLRQHPKVKEANFRVKGEFGSDPYRDVLRLGPYLFINDDDNIQFGTKALLRNSPIWRAEKIGSSTTEALEEDVAREKVYPNSSRGAKEMLSDLSTWDTTEAKAIPDPEVEGVWLVKNIFGKDDPSQTGQAIVYLAGYRDPWGEIRKDNDFEDEEFFESISMENLNSMYEAALSEKGRTTRIKNKSKLGDKMKRAERFEKKKKLDVNEDIDSRQAMKDFVEISKAATGLTFGDKYNDKQKTGRRMRIYFRSSDWPDTTYRDTILFNEKVRNLDSQKAEKLITRGLEEKGYDVDYVMVETDPGHGGRGMSVAGFYIQARLRNNLADLENKVLTDSGREPIAKIEESTGNLSYNDEVRYWTESLKATLYAKNLWNKALEAANGSEEEVMNAIGEEAESIADMYYGSDEGIGTSDINHFVAGVFRFLGVDDVFGWKQRTTEGSTGHGRFYVEQAKSFPGIYHVIAPDETIYDTYEDEEKAKDVADGLNHGEGFVFEEYARLKNLAGITQTTQVNESSGHMYNRKNDWLADAEKQGFEVEEGGDGKLYAHSNGKEAGVWDPNYGGFGMGVFFNSIGIEEGQNAGKTEHSGAKKGKGAYYGRKKDAKSDSNKKRRSDDKAAVSESMKGEAGRNDPWREPSPKDKSKLAPPPKSWFQVLDALNDEELIALYKERHPDWKYMKPTSMQSGWPIKREIDRRGLIVEGADLATHVNVEHRDPEGKFIIVHAPPAGYWAVGKGSYQHDIDRTSFDNFDDALDHAHNCLASIDESINEIRRLAGLKETASAGATGAGAVATAPAAVGGSDPISRRIPGTQSIYGQATTKPKRKKRKKAKEDADVGIGRSRKE